MHSSLKRRVGAGLALVALVGMLAACGDDSDDTSSGATTTEAPGSSRGSIDPADFTVDFSAMSALKDVAQQGKGLIGVLLPDTTSSARYETFDRPYLEAAFKAAGLSSSDYKIDNAQGSAQTMQILGGRSGAWGRWTIGLPQSQQVVSTLSEKG